MQDKVCLMTGSTNGIGLAAALELSRQGANLVLIARNKKRGEQTSKYIAKQTGNMPIVIVADLLEQAQVKEAARTFRSTFGRLDVLVNNAGYSYNPRQETSEGFEKTFALNYLAYFTLTLELIDLLISSAPARIINTSSNAHTWSDIDLNNLQGEKEFPMGPYGLTAMYGWTNVYRIMFTYELAERLKPARVFVNSLNPGFVPVKRSQTRWYLNIMTPILGLLPSSRSPREAAKTIIELATTSETGLYFDEGEPSRSIPQTYDTQVRQQLWHDTLKLLGYNYDPLDEVMANMK